MSAKVTISMTPEQFDHLRAAVKFAAAEAFEKYGDVRTKTPEDKKLWMMHDENYANWKRLAEHVLV